MGEHTNGFHETQRKQRLLECLAFCAGEELPEGGLGKLKAELARANRTLKSWLYVESEHRAEVEKLRERCGEFKKTLEVAYREMCRIRPMLGRGHHTLDDVMVAVSDVLQSAPEDGEGEG